MKRAPMPAGPDRERIEVAKLEASTKLRHMDGMSYFIEQCEAALAGNEDAQKYVLGHITKLSQP